MVVLTEKSISIELLIKQVKGPSVGGIDVFIGTVRNATSDKEVIALEFEAYEKMAILELQKIIDDAKNRWPIKEISIAHAIGKKSIGDLAVVIAVSASHRDAAFQGCRYVIDTLKKTVPIWKKEIFKDGDIWVAAHP